MEAQRVHIKAAQIKTNVCEPGGKEEVSDSEVDGMGMGQVKMRRTVKNVKTLVKTGGWGIAVFGGLCCTMAFFAASQKGMFISILLLLSGGLCFAVAKFFGHMNYLLFLLSFFSFMLGRMTADFLAYGTIGLPFSENTANHMLLSIALSLAALQTGFCFSAYILRKAKRPGKCTGDSRIDAQPIRCAGQT